MSGYNDWTGEPTVVKCTCCGRFQNTDDVVQVHGPFVDHAYYCDQCWEGVRTVKDNR